MRHNLHLIILLAVLHFFVQGAWAQVGVYDETQLREAINEAKYNIIIGGDIILNGEIAIEDNRNITIDLNGFTINRGLIEPAIYGHVFAVTSGCSLTINDSGGSGMITGGYCDNSGYGNSDSGGAIHNMGTVTINGGAISGNHSPHSGGAIHNAGTLIINGGTISDNEAKGYGGGAIANSGTVTINGGTISGNTSRSYGGGIYNGSAGTLNLYGGVITGNNSTDAYGCGIASEGTLNMQGNVTIKDNTKDDLFLYPGNVINVVGAITSGEGSIGLHMKHPGVFTSGYGASATAINPFFISKAPKGTLLVVEDGEYRMAFNYLNASLTESGELDVSEAYTPGSFTDFNTLAESDSISLTESWYVVSESRTVSNRVWAKGETHIILCDGVTLTLDRGLMANGPRDNAILHIHCQSFGDLMGRLVANQSSPSYPAIGAGQAEVVGTIIIHGGDIEANGADYGAGIGGGEDASGADLTIFDGVVHATGGSGAAGIGGGARGAGGNVFIYGGEVIAQSDDGAAIGGGVSILNTGEITLGDMKLSVGDSCLYWNDRIASCQSTGTVHLQVCDSHSYDYMVSETHHTGICHFCANSVTEPHDFGADDICTVCNYRKGDDPAGIVPTIVTIDRDGTYRYYDLQGLRLSDKPRNGLYIVDGKVRLSK